MFTQDEDKPNWVFSPQQQIDWTGGVHEICDSNSEQTPQSDVLLGAHPTLLVKVFNTLGGWT